MSEVKPAINVLTREQIKTIHDCSVEILSTAGIRVDSKRARKLFAETLGISETDAIVRIPAELVDRALETAPSKLDIYDRSGNTRFQLGTCRRPQTRFGIGVTNLYFQDPADDEVTSFTRKHMEISCRLGSALAGFDVISTIDVEQRIRIRQSRPRRAEGVGIDVELEYLRPEPAVNVLLAVLPVPVASKREQHGYRQQEP